MRLHVIGTTRAAALLSTTISADVSNATPFHPDHRNAEDSIEMGTHGMWGDMPYAHIMVPVAPAA